MKGKRQETFRSLRAKDRPKVRGGRPGQASLDYCPGGGLGLGCWAAGERRVDLHPRF